MQAVKDLYTQLFMLMLHSVEEDPEQSEETGTDTAIESLMETIEGSMQEFLGSVHTSRDSGAIAPELDGEIRAFEDNLKEALSTMHTRVQARMAQMARERDELKSRLQMIQRKRSGARGYRKGVVVAAESSLSEEALRASA